MKKKSSKVIVADLDKDNGDMLSLLLINKGYNVKVTSNADIFNEALNDHPDLIIINDPITEFIKILREKSKGRLPKLFLISKDRFTEHEKEILADKLNTVEILTFPFKLEEFEKKISCYL